jgi:hypothetical protein
MDTRHGRIGNNSRNKSDDVFKFGADSVLQKGSVLQIPDSKRTIDLLRLILQMPRK